MNELVVDVGQHVADRRHVDELNDDLGPLLRRAAAQHHALHPLRQTVEQVDGPLEARVVAQRARHRVLLVILKLITTNKFSNKQQQKQ